jgi:hypothetical protein
LYRFARWQPLLNSASTEADVLRIMREYLAALLPEDVALLPENCRISSIRSTEDVETAAVTLAQCDLKANHADPASKLLTEMAHTFAWAQARLRDLRSRWPAPDQ